MKCSRIFIRKKITSKDLTVEIFDCNLKCHYCFSKYGQKFHPAYLDSFEILKRIAYLNTKYKPDLIRITGGEISFSGDSGIDFLRKVSFLIDSPIIIETNLTIIDFFKKLSTNLPQEVQKKFYFIISIKNKALVFKGHYNTKTIINNIKILYNLFPWSFISHGFIGFNQPLEISMKEYFPEINLFLNEIYIEKEGRFKFQALKVQLNNRFLYFFDQRIKKYASTANA